VVTGTLLGGSFSVGEEIEILPSGLRGRIRGLQTHNTQLEIARPGSRVAINVSGMEVEALRRGDAVVRPGTFVASSMLDVHVRQLANAPSPLKHNQAVKLFLGAAQRMGRLRMLGGERTLQPGDEGWLQIQLNEPVAAAKGDRYILRRPSPPVTLGGGQIVDPNPVWRHRLKDRSVVRSLERVLKGSPEDQLEMAVLREGTPTLSEAAGVSGLSQEQAGLAAAALVEAGRVLPLSSVRLRQGTKLVGAAVWGQWSREVLDALAAFHADQPMRSGMGQELLKSQLGVSQDVFDALLRDLVESGQIVHQPPELRLAAFKVELTADQLQKAEELLARFEATEAAPSMKDAKQLVGEALVRHLIGSGELVALSREVLLSRSVYDRWLASTVELLQQGQTLTVAQARDHFGSSRKYVLAFLEHLDAEGITLRQGDLRRLNPTRKS
jgi:selenocysteine-specific elongation factor